MSTKINRRLRFFSLYNAFRMEKLFWRNDDGDDVDVLIQESTTVNKKAIFRARHAAQQLNYSHTEEPWLNILCWNNEIDRAALYYKCIPHRGSK